ncbi:MAG: DUF2335 domain-containing protein [Gemmatimonadaceae bacterium]|nr:DUF2335 domain-containing protein [Gemmatimonadaceae bacterium]
MAPVGGQPIVRDVAPVGPSNRPYVAVARTSHTGPLPTPEDFGGYDAVLPGAANRILRMAETQSAHRQRIESIAVSGNTLAQILGVLIAGGLAYITIDGAVALLLAGKPVEGLATLVTSIGALVGVFVWGRKQQTQQLAKKMASEMTSKGKR